MSKREKNQFVADRRHRDPHVGVHILLILLALFELRSRGDWDRPEPLYSLADKVGSPVRTRRAEGYRAFGTHSVLYVTAGRIEVIAPLSRMRERGLGERVRARREGLYLSASSWV